MGLKEGDVVWKEDCDGSWYYGKVVVPPQVGEQRVCVRAPHPWYAGQFYVDYWDVVECFPEKPEYVRRAEAYEEMQQRIAQLTWEQIDSLREWLDRELSP